MHPAPVAAFAEPGTAAANLGMAKGSTSTRSVFYGYIPVTIRDSLVPPLADPGAVLKDAAGQHAAAQSRRSTRPSSS